MKLPVWLWGDIFIPFCRLQEQEQALNLSIKEATAKVRHVFFLGCLGGWVNVHEFQWVACWNWKDALCISFSLINPHAKCRGLYSCSYFYLMRQWTLHGFSGRVRISGRCCFESILLKMQCICVPSFVCQKNKTKQREVKSVQSLYCSHS